jgi:hypothetical protein
MADATAQITTQQEASKAAADGLAESLQEK